MQLTPQLRKVADLIGDGLTNPEIEGRMGLRRETVKSYVKRALRRTGARNRTHLAILMRRMRGPREWDAAAVTRTLRASGKLLPPSGTTPVR